MRLFISFLKRVNTFLTLLRKSLPITKGQSFMPRHRRKLQFSARQPAAAKQLSVGFVKIPVKCRIQDGVKGWVKIAQPQHHRVKRVGGDWPSSNAHAGEEGEVGKPADNKGPEYSCQGHCRFVLPGDGCSWCRACKWWSGGTNTPRLEIKKIDV